MNIEEQLVLDFLSANHVQPMNTEVVPTVYDNGEEYELAVSLMETDEDTGQPSIYKELTIATVQAERGYDEVKEEWIDTFIKILSRME